MSTVLQLQMPSTFEIMAAKVTGQLVRMAAIAVPQSVVASHTMSCVAGELEKVPMIGSQWVLYAVDSADVQVASVCAEASGTIARRRTMRENINFAKRCRTTGGFDITACVRGAGVFSSFMSTLSRKMLTNYCTIASWRRHRPQRTNEGPAVWGVQSG